jgi:uncharacterized protein YukE
MSMMSAHPLKMPNDAMNCAGRLSDSRGSSIRTWRGEVVSALADAFAQIKRGSERFQMLLKEANGIRGQGFEVR